MVFVAGQIGWDERQAIVSDDLAVQLGQALDNTLAVLREAGAGPEHVVRMTWYVTDKRDYLARARELGEVYRALHGPALSGDGRGRGERADRGPRQGRDRDHRGLTRPPAPPAARDRRAASRGSRGARPDALPAHPLLGLDQDQRGCPDQDDQAPGESDTGRVSNSTCIGGA